MRALIAVTALPVLMFALAHGGRAAGPHTRTSEPFAGVKANAGTVTHSTEGGRERADALGRLQGARHPGPALAGRRLQGRTYLRQRLQVKGDKVNRSIMVPAYVPE